MTAVAPAAAVFAGALAGQAQAQKDMAIAQIPDLTTDAFHITLHRGARRGADALGVELLFQGRRISVRPCRGRCWTAVIARGPDAILITPTDKVQLIEPLCRAHDAGIPL